MGKYDFYTTFDDPIPYRKNKNSKELLFYPIKVRDVFKLSACEDLLLVCKNELFTDPEESIRVIQMKDLDFFFIYNNSENNYLLKLYWLLKTCLRISDEDNETIKFLKDDAEHVAIQIGDILYDNQDFLEFKEIIASQNAIELPNQKVAKDVRDILDAAEEWKRKQSGNTTKMGSFEDILICVFISAPFNGLEEVCNLSLRKFYKLLERINMKMDYQIYMTAAMSGMVEFKDKSVLKHWMGDSSKEKYSDVLVDAEQYKADNRQILKQ